MNRSKKLAITLAVLAVLGGSVYIQPEQGFAAEYVIDSQYKFDYINNGNDNNWGVDDNKIKLNEASSDNTLVFKKITSYKSLIGGYGSLANADGSSADANNNTIVLINSYVDTTDIPGVGSGGNHIIGGFTGHGKDANNNKVILINSEIQAHIFGGDSTEGNACGNTIIIDNSEIISDEREHDIYGGYAFVVKKDDDSYEDGVVSGHASNNTIIIRNGSKLEGSKIYGGYLTLTGYENTDDLTEEDFKKENNTLILDNWSGSVKAVRSCDNVNFYNVNLSDFVTKADVEPTKAILTITGNTNEYTDCDFSNIIGTDKNPLEDINGDMTKDINIGLSFQGGQDINVNDKVRLIQMDQDTQAIIDEKKGEKIHLANNGTAYAGVAQVVKGELKFDEDNNKYLDYTITSVGLNDQVNVVNEGRATSAAFLNQSDELISEALAGLNLEDKYGFETFAMVYGNDSRYGTNSDLSINGWSGLVGVGSNNKTKAGDFAWAAFFENGAGNYDISTTMNGITMEGDGSTVYNGGGIAARLTGENGVYGEASLRAGLLKNDLEHGLQNQNGEAFGYESESNYYGMHIGIGKIFKLENGASVDTYAKYYHSTVKDDSFTIDGDEFEMDDINSDRLRLGIRYNQGMNREFNVYYGAAWEYEFNGESNGYAQGHKMEETSLKGSTVIGELGVVIQPENSPWSFDAKVKGYGGQRDGYSGSILATYHF